jgi:hypothetical protein
MREHAGITGHSLDRMLTRCGSVCPMRSEPGYGVLAKVAIICTPNFNSLE